MKSYLHLHGRYSSSKFRGALLLSTMLILTTVIVCLWVLNQHQQHQDHQPPAPHQPNLYHQQPQDHQPPAPHQPNLYHQQPQDHQPPAPHQPNLYHQQNPLTQNYKHLDSLEAARLLAKYGYLHCPKITTKKRKCGNGDDKEIERSRRRWLVAAAQALRRQQPQEDVLLSAALRHRRRLPHCLRRGGGEQTLNFINDHNLSSDFHNFNFYHKNYVSAKGRVPFEGKVAPHRRTRRSVFTLPGHPLRNRVITWRVGRGHHSSRLGMTLSRAVFSLAFRIWSEVIPSVFVEDLFSPAGDVDVLVGFAARQHLGCSRAFDGVGGELGHALSSSLQAQIHLDDDDLFSIDPDGGTQLLQVAVHEIGHVLGLTHVLRRASVMFAMYSQDEVLELDDEDRRLVQAIHGHCAGRFVTVFDLVTTKSDGSLTYTTFFFRRHRYWMYDNRRRRARPGDPLLVSVGWPGLPDAPDAFVHIWTPGADRSIFFKGTHYYAYDAAEERILPGYPRKISRDFRSSRAPKAPHVPRRPPKIPNERDTTKLEPLEERGTVKRLPSNMDAAFFDKRDGNLYVIKDNLVYGYNVSEERHGCCLPGYPRPLQEEFLPADANTEPISGKLDAVYYSYHFKSLFLFKGREYWQVVSYHPLDPHRTNLISGPHQVHLRWPDVCDTDPVHVRP
ncbi:matrix metalloproteinase-21-like [Hyalella azteca]|uniref:Matrix metalloproteinase-21-like n=1 Tax=Hyalella azteca TaxID=294128 RepID=A0A979FLC7_HYAAZ|nr:matrix metalloproteinase-21-like [Hyalella azteca]